MMPGKRAMLVLIAAAVLGSGTSPTYAQEEPDALPRRGSLGVALGSDAAGAITITSIQPESSALEAQLRVGDIIEALDGQRVRSAAECRRP